MLTFCHGYYSISGRSTHQQKNEVITMIMHEELESKDLEKLRILISILFGVMLIILFNIEVTSINKIYDTTFHLIFYGFITIWLLSSFLFGIRSLCRLIKCVNNNKEVEDYNHLINTYKLWVTILPFVYIFTFIKNPKIIKRAQHKYNVYMVDKHLKNTEGQVGIIPALNEYLHATPYKDGCSAERMSRCLINIFTRFEKEYVNKTAYHKAEHSFILFSLNSWHSARQEKQVKDGYKKELLRINCKISYYEQLTVFTTNVLNQIDTNTNYSEENIEGVIEFFKMRKKHT